jgi:cell division protein FtsL
MTIIRPYQKFSLVDVLLFISLILLFFASLALVIIYNYVVNFENSILEKQKEIKKVETQIAESKEDLFNLLSSENLKKIAEENGLIEEKNPEYVELNSNQWLAGLNL